MGGPPRQGHQRGAPRTEDRRARRQARRRLHELRGFTLDGVRDERVRLLELVVVAERVRQNGFVRRRQRRCEREGATRSPRAEAAFRTFVAVAEDVFLLAVVAVRALDEARHHDPLEREARDLLGTRETDGPGARRGAPCAGPRALREAFHERAKLGGRDGRAPEPEGLRGGAHLGAKLAEPAQRARVLPQGRDRERPVTALLVRDRRRQIARRRLTELGAIQQRHEPLHGLAERAALREEPHARDEALQRARHPPIVGGLGHERRHRVDEEPPRSIDVHRHVPQARREARDARGGLPFVGGFHPEPRVEARRAKQFEERVAREGTFREGEQRQRRAPVGAREDRSATRLREGDPGFGEGRADVAERVVGRSRHHDRDALRGDAGPDRVAHGGGHGARFGGLRACGSNPEDAGARGLFPHDLRRVIERPPALFEVIRERIRGACEGVCGSSARVGAVRRRVLFADREARQVKLDAGAALRAGATVERLDPEQIVDVPREHAAEDGPVEHAKLLQITGRRRSDRAREDGPRAARIEPACRAHAQIQSLLHGGRPRPEPASRCRREERAPSQRPDRAVERGGERDGRRLRGRLRAAEQRLLAEHLLERLERRERERHLHDRRRPRQHRDRPEHERPDGLRLLERVAPTDGPPVPSGERGLDVRFGREEQRAREWNHGATALRRRLPVSDR